jgi:hypothetical protein
LGSAKRLRPHFGVRRNFPSDVSGDLAHED